MIQAPAVFGLLLTLAYLVGAIPFAAIIAAFKKIDLSKVGSGNYGATNVFAIAAGCLDALDYGQNAKAALITRGLVELQRLFTYFDASHSTLMGLSGLGDLIATCTSSKSRNWQLGYDVVTQPDRQLWEASNRGQRFGISVWISIRYIPK